MSFSHPFLLSFRSVCGLALLFAIGCARAPIKDIEDSMRPTSDKVEFRDDLALLDLEQDIRANVARLRSRPILGAEPQNLVFGPKLVSRERYAAELENLAESLRLDPSGDLFQRNLQSHFDFYEVYGDKKWGEVMVTGYYEPLIEGSRQKTKKHSRPIYQTPRDLVRLELANFKSVGSSWATVDQNFRDQVHRDGVIRGRLEKTAEGSFRIQPYFSRQQIDQQGALKTEGLELAWLDPIDAFFLQIQGSGTVTFPDGAAESFGYAEQNGHPYTAIGRFLKDKIPMEEMSSHRIEAYLRSVSPQDADRLMSRNPSYIFFQKLKTKPLTAFGIEAVAGRSIATDPKYFPKGAMAFLQFEKPVFYSSDALVPAQYETSGRLVFDHDTGGAIRGTHRVDLFWGRGREAEQASGVMKHPGRLYYLVPKETLD